MSAIVGALRATLGLDSAAFDKGLKGAARQMTAFQKGMRKWAVGLGAASAGISLAFAGIAPAIKQQVDAADELGNMAEKMGIPIETLSRLKYAAELSDVSLSTLATATRKLSQNMVAAGKDGSPMAKLFADIGVSATNTDGSLRSTEQVMADVAAVLSAMPEGAEKTALAMKLLGKSGTEMLPFLNAGKDSINAMMREAEEFGLVISKDTADAADGFNKNLDRLSAVARGVAIELMAALAPALERVSNLVVDAAKWFRDLSPAMQEILASGLVFAAGLAPVLVGLAGVVWAVGMVGGAFKALAVVLLANPIGLTIAAIAAAGALIYYNWDGLAAWFSEMWVSIGAAFTAGWTAVKDAHVVAYNALVDTWNAVPEFFAGLMGQIGVAFDAAWIAIKAKFFQWVEDFKQIGRDLMAGFTAGITAGEPAAETAIYDAMGNVTGHAESALGIQSPSKVFKRIGGFIMEGLGLGIREGVPMATDAMGEVSEAVAGSGNSLTNSLKGLGDTAREAFKGLATGAMSAKDAVASLLNKMADMFLDSAFDSIFGGLFGGGGGLFAKGAAFSGGSVTAFAKGGIVDQATAFGMSHGRMGVMGEAGPEAIMPLTRGAGGKLGVEASGGGKVDVAIRVQRDGEMQAFVESVSSGVAARVVDHYDANVLPQRHRSMMRDPRKL